MDGVFMHMRVAIDEKRNTVSEERLNRPEYTKKPNRLYSLIRKHGILNFTRLAFRYALMKTIGLDWQRFILLERSLAEPIQEVVPRIKVTIRQATEDDLDRF